MKHIYQTPVALLNAMDEEDILTVSGFTKEEEGEGDRIGIKDLKF